MRKKSLVISLLLTGLMFITGLKGGYSQGVEDFIKTGDEYYAKYDNPKALEEYLKAYQVDSINCQALWKISRAYVDIGEVAKKELQKANYLLAEKYGRKAVAHCPQDAESHFNLAVAVGRVALYEGGKTKIRLSKEVKVEADKAIELNPNHDGAYHVIARWHREIANLSGVLKFFAKVIYGGVPPGASNEEAIRNFNRAIEIKPEHINHHLELGITYKIIKQYDLARAEFQKVLDLPVSDADDPDHKTEAQKLLEEIKDKK